MTTSLIWHLGLRRGDNHGDRTPLLEEIDQVLFASDRTAARTFELTLGAKLGAIRCGFVWTAMDMEAIRFGLCGRLWTAVDTPWRSTDQKVGGSSPSGRATEALALQGLLPFKCATVLALLFGLPRSLPHSGT